MLRRHPEPIITLAIAAAVIAVSWLYFGVAHAR